ncbi:MAG: hypothetical protein AB1801_00845, partial [Chloroflexota bacterium]
FIALLMLGYGVIRIVPVQKTEIPAETATPVPAQTATAPAAAAAAPAAGQEQPAPPQNQRPHGLFYAFVLPLLIFGFPWIVIQLVIIRYLQPRGVDLSQVRLKAQDGLFIEAAVSMTARRTLTLASTRMTWPRVRDFVEKIIEQELIHEALQFATLMELEQNLKYVTENFLQLPIVKELSRDFGVEVLRFNAEARYPQETMDALNRRAEAAAGGSAYLAYAAAAHLDPDTPECRQLYKIFQETSGQVDAARNLGGGITNLVNALGSRERKRDYDDDGPDQE